MAGLRSRAESEITGSYTTRSKTRARQNASLGRAIHRQRPGCRSRRCCVGPQELTRRISPLIQENPSATIPDHPPANCEYLPGQKGFPPMLKRRTALSFQIRVTVALLFVLACGSSYAQDSASYGIAAEKDVMIPMRDGVRLAADIYRPAHGVQAIDGKFPGILMRTHYNKET